MGLRFKCILLLLLFSLLPLVTLFLMHQRVFLGMGQDVYQIARILLLQTTAKEMQTSADNYAANASRAFRSIEAHVTQLGEEMSRDAALAPASEASLGPRLPVLYRRLRALRREVVCLRIRLAGGKVLQHPPGPVGSGFPRPGGDSPRPAFSDSEPPRWSIPDGSGDGSAAGEVFTVTVPLRGSVGAAVGTLSADIDMVELLEAIRPSSQWSLFMQSLLLRMGTPGKGAVGLPATIAERDPAADRPAWTAGGPPLAVAPQAVDRVFAILDGSRYGTEGYVSLPWNGEVSLWAFSRADHTLGFLHILPEREVLYRIARHPGRLGRWLALDSFLVVAAVVLLMIVVVLQRSRRLLAPFFSMVSAFRRLSEGDFSVRLASRARDERRMVADAFNAMAGQLEDGMRVRQALEVAQEVQQNFIAEPRPEVAGLDIAARIQYCEETGGDCIDLIRTVDGRVAFAVSDVTGHGIGAALLMATARALIRGLYASGSGPAGVVNTLNRQLTADMGDTGRFVTLFLLEIDPGSGRIAWVRAGHDPAWRYGAEDGRLSLLDGAGMALGVEDGIRYAEACGTPLRPGDVLLIGTDGIWEAPSEDGSLFGKHRVEEALLANAAGSAEDICDALMAAVNRFMGSRRQEDDISMVVIKVPE